jgi:AcrR family transcriptional regulator
MPRPRTRSDDEVLAATARVLGRRGPHAFTLADVAKETGLAPATLLQRFGTKRGLLLAFARWASTRVDTPFDEAARRGGSPLAQLRRGLQNLAGPTADRREFANHLALLLEDMRDPELRRAAAAHARRTEQNITRLLRAAVAAGEIVVGQPERWAATVFAAWNGALIQWGLRGVGPLSAALDAVLDPLLLTPPGRRTRVSMPRSNPRQRRAGR